MRWSMPFAAVLAAAPLAWCDSGRSIWLDELDLSPIQQGWGDPRANRSVRNNPLRVAGVTYEHGVGSHVRAAIHIALDGRTQRFEALAGVDDETRGRGTVTGTIYGGGKRLFKSGILRGKQPPLPIDLDLAKVEQEVTALWDDIGVQGGQAVRDLWRHQDLGIHDKKLTIRIPRHGVALLRLRPEQVSG